MNLRILIMFCIPAAMMNPEACAYKDGATTGSGVVSEKPVVGEASFADKPLRQSFKASLSLKKLEKPLDVPGASALPGDYLLQNELISVVVNAVEHTSGNALTGGYIIDAFRNDRPIDNLAQLHLYHNDQYPRMARFKSLEPATSPERGTVALVAHGVDSADETLDVVTTYTLRAGENKLELATAVIPRNNPLKDFVLGDAFAWGQTQQFVPGLGFKVGGRINAPWVGGEGRGVAYGLYSNHGNVWGPTGSNWIDPNGTTVTLSVNEAGVYTRYFIVAADLAEVSSTVFADGHVVNISVLEAESRRGATGVAVAVNSNGKPVTQARSRDGKAALRLPAGRYTLSPHDNVRTAVTTETVIEAPGDTQTVPELLVSSPAVVAFKVVEQGGKTGVPCKLRFIGRNGTPDPDLGPAHEIITRNVVYLKDGTGRIPMPAGDYDIVVSRGIEYNIETVPASLKRNIESTIHVRLQRAFDKGNYISGDLHQHMKNSFDSAIPLEDRVISSAGEGLDFLVATDHNFVTDLRPVVTKLKLDDWIFTITGNEITTRKFFFGHFNAFPLVAQPGKPNNGASDFEGVTASQLFDAANAAPGEQVLQVNHPRSSDIGYFNQVYLSRDDGVTTHINWSDKFTAIEVFNGKRVDEFDESFPDWCNLLNLGYVFTATGNSDSHRIYDMEPGYPRTYVRLHDTDLTGEKRVSAVVNVLNDTHAAFVTNGPFVEFSLRTPRAEIGQTVSSKGPLRFDCQILGADFCRPSVLEFYGNGKLINTTDFAETSGPVKLDTGLEDDPAVDTWYTVVVRGTHSLFPVVNPLVQSNTTAPALPLAFTNPIWIDRDGDGKFRAVNASQYDGMHMDRSAEAAAQLDTLTSNSQNREVFRRVRTPTVE